MENTKTRQTYNDKFTSLFLVCAIIGFVSIMPELTFGIKIAITGAIMFASPGIYMVIYKINEHNITDIESIMLLTTVIIGLLLLIAGVLI